MQLLLDMFCFNPNPPNDTITVLPYGVIFVGKKSNVFLRFKASCVPRRQRLTKLDNKNSEKRENPKV